MRYTMSLVLFFDVSHTHVACPIFASTPLILPPT